MNYEIEDPRPINAANPYSFQIPCRERLDAIAVDDHVKAIFLPKDGGPGDRMWVHVVEVDGDVLRGTLANQPLTVDIAHGDTVELQRHHVIAIDTKRADDPPETQDYDHLFDRCLVDARIKQGAPIRRIVRDEPEPAHFHGQGSFAWSGWRFEAEGYEPGMDAEVYALVVPLRIEDGYVDMLAIRISTWKIPPVETLVRSLCG